MTPAIFNKSEAPMRPLTPLLFCAILADGELLRDLARTARQDSWGNPEYLAACDAIERGEIIPPMEMLKPILFGPREAEKVRTIARLSARWAARELRIREDRAMQQALIEQAQED